MLLSLTNAASSSGRVLSLGAGVQSSTLYLMAVRGVFGVERPEVALGDAGEADEGGVADEVDDVFRDAHSSMFPDERKRCARTSGEGGAIRLDWQV